MKEVVIIGAGPAGLTASIYLKRAGIDHVIIEKGLPGGQINWTSKIENYPGYELIDGIELAQKMKTQVTKLGVEIINDEVVDIIDAIETKTVVLKNQEIKCKKIIIATGRFSKDLNLENERELKGRGVSTCATCDGAFFKGKDVAIVGGGNSAAIESLYLSKICNKVTIICRKPYLRADKKYQEEIKQKENIEIIYEAVVKKINQKDNMLSSIEIETKNKTKELSISGLFISIGYEPKIDFLKSTKLRTSKKYIIVNKKMETSVKGIYACGDCIKKDLYQIVTSTSDGAIAATSVKEGL